MGERSTRIAMIAVLAAVTMIAGMYSWKTGLAGGSAARAVTYVHPATPSAVVSHSPTPSPSPAASPLGPGTDGPYGARQSTEGTTVALTFDDGPHPTYTPQVLALLRRYQVKATFCVVGVQAQALQTKPRTIFFQEKTAQQQDVVAPFAQRRHVHGVDAQPVVEVAAVAAQAHLFIQVAIGGGNQAHVHVAFLVRTNALQLSAGQHPQQLGLHHQR